MLVPKTSRHSLPPAGELPGTLRRSSEQAQQTFTRALTRAVQASGEGDQAVRAAFAEFQRTFEKRGDHPLGQAARVRQHAGQEAGPPVVEQDDAIAQQAPALPGLICHDPCGEVIRCRPIRAPRLVLTHLSLRCRAAC